MSSITLPVEFVPATCSLRGYANQRGSAAPFGGSEQYIDLLNDRWLCSVDLMEDYLEVGAAIEAFIGAMRGQTNTVDLYHFVRPMPSGTVRGTLTLGASAAQGAASIVVAGCNPSNGTLMRGDMLGVGGLLVMVASNCTASGGTITIPITNRLRAAKAAGASVVWDRPTAPFRLTSTTGVTYSGSLMNPVTLDFAEAIA